MEPLKNAFSTDIIRILSSHVKRAYPTFDEGRFLKRIPPEIEEQGSE